MYFHKNKVAVNRPYLFSFFSQICNMAANDIKTILEEIEKGAKYPRYGAYPIPEKNILVLSCIDLRLTDDTVKFLHHDNLANRYDHFILAGASLCACVEKTKKHFKIRCSEKIPAVQPLEKKPS